MTLQALKKLNLPDAPGVYFFKKGSSILYIGKATSLSDRVKSYFTNDLIQTRGRLLVDMVTQATTVDFEQTDSVLEAFLLETELIKKHQPKYNTKEKDNKSFNYVVITKEEYPRVLVVRGRNLEQSIDLQYTDSFGPFPFGTELREALKLIRKIFPYRDTCKPLKENKSGKPCFNASIGLCPGVCDGRISRADYLKQINNIRLFFKGKKKKLLADLTKQMSVYAKKHEFEKASDVKRTIQALSHINDISMIKDDRKIRLSSSAVKSPVFRIEAYDIAHISGKDMVGVMVVANIVGGVGSDASLGDTVEGDKSGEVEFVKSEYKKFNIKSVSGANDTAALKEVLERRLAHTEWLAPDMIVIDGGQAQLNAAEGVLRAIKNQGKIKKLISLVSVLKDDRHKAKNILISKEFGGINTVASISSQAMYPVVQIEDKSVQKMIVSINAESHRFALAFHTRKRSKSLGF